MGTKPLFDFINTSAEKDKIVLESEEVDEQNFVINVNEAETVVILKLYDHIIDVYK